MPNGEGRRISAIGITVFVNGEITRQFYSLVNPETWFQPYVVKLIGITPEMVETAPTFPELWPQIEPLFHGSVLVAHGAGNDLKALSHCLRHYKIEWEPLVPYLCTVDAACACYPERQGYSLDLMCEDFGIALQHHHALSDSAACGKLLLRCMADGLDADRLVKQFDLTAGHNEKQKRKRKRKRKAKGEAPDAVQLIREDLDALAQKTAARRGTAEATDGQIQEYFHAHCNDAAIYAFFQILPHETQAENRLHAVILSNRSRFSVILQGIEALLPYVEDEATLRLLRPKLFSRRQPELADPLRRWLLSDDPIRILFALQTLRLYYINTPKLPLFLEIVHALGSDDPAIRSAQTAFFAAALKKAPARTAAFQQTHVRTEQEDQAIAQVLAGKLPKRGAEAILALAQEERETEAALAQ